MGWRPPLLDELAGTSDLLDDQGGETVTWKGNIMQIGSFFRTSGILTGEDEETCPQQKDGAKQDYF